MMAYELSPSVSIEEGGSGHPYFNYEYIMAVAMEISCLRNDYSVDFWIARAGWCAGVSRGGTEASFKKFVQDV